MRPSSGAYLSARHVQSADAHPPPGGRSATGELFCVQSCKNFMALACGVRKLSDCKNAPPAGMLPLSAALHLIPLCAREPATAHGACLAARGGRLRQALPGLAVVGAAQVARESADLGRPCCARQLRLRRRRALPLRLRLRPGISSSAPRFSKSRSLTIHPLQPGLSCPRIVQALHARCARQIDTMRKAVTRHAGPAHPRAGAAFPCGHLLGF